MIYLPWTGQPLFLFSPNLHRLAWWFKLPLFLKCMESKESYSLLHSKERKAVDGIKCVRAVGLHLVIVFWLAFLFRMNDNSCVFWSLQVTYFLLLYIPVSHFVLAKAALSGMEKQILQHRRNISCWLSHIPLDKVKTYSSWGSQGLCLSRDVLVPKVCLCFFLPNILEQKRVWTKK